MFQCGMLTSEIMFCSGHCQRIYIVFLLTLLASVVCGEFGNMDGSTGTQGKDGSWDCKLLDACSDPLGFEAIRLLHYQLDDDANGDVDVVETDEFLRDELNYENGYERQKGFHRNDKHITVDELWMTWKSSEVHNWTVEETVTWLVSNVELPQYVEVFQQNEINGTTLPRMAINSSHFLSSALGIKDPIHKHKISLKAMDIVLFGPPKSHNYFKDIILACAVIIATCGLWYARVQHKCSQTQMRKMVKDMESLQHAEESLSDLQKELDRAKMEQELVVNEKKELEKRLQSEITAVKLQNQLSDSSASFDAGREQQLEEELKMVLQELNAAKTALQTKSWVPPPMLQPWLQLTYELELRHYNGKKTAAEQQLASAKEGYEKLRKKKTNFMGAFRVAHGNSIDDVDNRILAAKSALSEVTKDLQERLHRWKQIELLCGFTIVHNPGLHRLQSLVGSAMNKGILSSHTTVKSRISRSGSVSTLSDDDPSFSSGVSAIQQLVHNSATLFLAPLPTSYMTGFQTPPAPQNYSSSVSPCQDPVTSHSSTSSHHTSVATSGNELSYANGSLANTSVGCSPHMGVHMDALGHSMRNATSADLKTCASSNAILQCSDSSNHEQLPEISPSGKLHKTYQDLSIDDNSLHYSPGGSDRGRPVFTVGSNKDIITRSPLKTASKSYSQDQPHSGKEHCSQTFSCSEIYLASTEPKEKLSMSSELSQSHKFSKLGSAASAELREGSLSGGSSGSADEKNRKVSVVSNLNQAGDKML